MPWDHDFRDLLATQAMINTILINAALLFYALASRSSGRNRAWKTSTSAPKLLSRR